MPAMPASTTSGRPLPDGDQGFPGAVTLDLTYTLTDNNDFKNGIQGDRPPTIYTVVNFTNHTYYNLAGNGSGQCREPGA